MIDAAQAEDGLCSLVQFIVVIIQSDRGHRRPGKRDVLSYQVGTTQRVVSEADLTDRIGRRSKRTVGVSRRSVGLDHRARKIVEPVSGAGKIGGIDRRSYDASESIGRRGRQSIVLPSALVLALAGADANAVKGIELDNLGGRARQHVIGPTGGVIGGVDQFNQVSGRVIIHQFDIGDLLLAGSPTEQRPACDRVGNEQRDLAVGIGGDDRASDVGDFTDAESGSGIGNQAGNTQVQRRGLGNPFDGTQVFAAERISVRHGAIAAVVGCREQSPGDVECRGGFQHVTSVDRGLRRDDAAVAAVSVPELLQLIDVLITAARRIGAARNELPNAVADRGGGRRLRGGGRIVVDSTPVPFGLARICAGGGQ